ncbi:hypothetical protein KPATCC21470_8712 [Kitasatospora purpeofusca]
MPPCRTGHITGAGSTHPNPSKASSRRRPHTGPAQWAPRTSNAKRCKGRLLSERRARGRCFGTFVLPTETITEQLHDLVCP